MKHNIWDKESKQRVIGIINDLSPEKRWVVSVTEQKSTRSINQNSLYWKWLDIIRLHIMDSTGQIFTADEVAEWMKARFLPSRVVEIGGEATRCRSTTTKLNTAEMAAYLDLIDKYCVDSLKLYLPQPGEPTEG